MTSAKNIQFQKATVLPNLTLFGRGQRINEIAEILVAIFFVCLNIKCFQV
jgi:uncharacterized membrane protein